MMGAMSGTDFMTMGGDSAFGMFETMGNDRVVEMEGDAMAGMFGAMGAEHLSDIGHEGVADAFSAMGIESAIGMGGASLAEMFSAMGGDNIGSVGAEGMQEAALSMTGDALAHMTPEAAAAMMDTMGSAEATEALGGEQLAGLIGAINPDQLAEVMPSEVLMEAAEKMTIEDFGAMSGEGGGHVRCSRR